MHSPNGDGMCLKAPRIHNYVTRPTAAVSPAMATAAGKTAAGRPMHYIGGL